ncbi:4-nitrophenylphosphatase [Operophtera brumata]|uniref:4-nitrophenylphosphatase n=1 Tax=Operophtera brumata TaxID=104452 RepID=A0A0L7LHW0_OPEBR|nr:4-nitrophenylphosphatase [Operophtera brumata]
MATPVNLLELGAGDFKQFLDSFDHVFSDCDGVIWAKTPLPGSSDFFKLIKKYGKTVNYVSNNSIRTRDKYDARFQAAGEPNNTLHSDSRVPEICQLQEESPHEPLDHYEKFVEYLKDDEEIAAVVFDSDFKINLAKIYKAVTYLSRPDVLFLSGTGVFTDLVTEQVKRDPVQLGKPGKVFGEFAMKRAGVTDPSRVLFIGDMIEQDVGLGKATGFKTLLVLTNISEDKMMNHEIKPDFYAPSLGKRPNED